MTIPSMVMELHAPAMRGRRLSRNAVFGAGLSGVALAGVLNLAYSTWRWAEFVVLGVVFALAFITAASWAVEGRRKAVDRLVSNVVVSAFLVALAPLALVVYFTAVRGIPHFSAVFFTHSLAGVPPSETGGGIAAAIQGTVEQVFLATLISVPIGLLVAVYVTEYGRGVFARAIRFLVDVMTGIPSIVAGLFIYTFLVIGLHQGFSGFAGSLALSILMLPVVIRSAEEMIALVPKAYREASYALGVTRWRTIVSVVLPTAMGGLVTGVMLAVARVTGETAPLLLTAFDNNYLNANPFKGQQSSLSLIVYTQAQQAYQPAIDRAWAAAATLILIVIGLYVVARLLTRRSAFRHG
ncbi:MAG TPA: phosphate ABC transporter permease PstA [Acidothermaceae bacterium]|nr:phosphate ABC transporter permease PstA [Acidothermaceae bacterium]